MFFSRVLSVVFNTKGGGRMWNKHWGLIRISQTRKANRRRDIAIFNKNMSILKAAAHLEPEVPTRLYQPLPEWRRKIMAKRLEAARRAANWSSSPLLHQASSTAGAGVAASQAFTAAA